MVDMVVLFVHGMGRSPMSGWPVLQHLRRAGMKTTSFGYMTSMESFHSIQSRLVERIVAVAATGHYIVIGHSLGGVLLRAALNSLPATAIRPQHVFLLGSPVHPSRLAQRLKNNILYRALAGDCGQVLASPERMNEVGALNEPATSIVGIRGIAATRSFFGEEPNDGVVAVSEASAEWITDRFQVPIIHTLLPSSRDVAKFILEKVDRK